MFDPELALNISNKFFNNSHTQTPDLGVDFNQRVQKWTPLIDQYTGLQVKQFPQAEVLSRSEWTEHNILAAKPMLDKLSEQVDNVSQSPLSAFLPADITSNIGKTIISGQVGLLFGFFSQKVLGQVEAYIMSGEDKPLRLMFLGQNLEKSAKKLEVDPQDFYDWVIIHELTHVYQFSAVPWLKPFLFEKMQEHIEHVQKMKEQTFNISNIMEKIKNQDFSLVDVSQSESLQQVQIVMSLVEGYAEHVMDVVGTKEISSIPEMRAKLQKQRENGSAGITGIIMKLLGMETKMSQYEDGREWCKKVVELSDISTLNRVWESPEHMPSQEEFGNPQIWIQRISGTPTTATPQVTETTTSSSQDDERFLVSLISGKCDIKQDDFVRWVVLAETKKLVEYQNGSWEVTVVGRQRLVEILQSEV